MNEIIVVIASLTGLFVAGANATFWAITKFNDMKHLSDDIKEIKDSIKCIEKKLYQNITEISEIKGTCKANHRI